MDETITCPYCKNRFLKSDGEPVKIRQKSGFNGRDETETPLDRKMREDLF